MDKHEKDRIAKIVDLLLEVIKDRDSVYKWLSSKNQAFNNKSPFDLIKSGDYETVENAVYYLRSGTAG